MLDPWIIAEIRRHEEEQRRREDERRDRMEIHIETPQEGDRERGSRSRSDAGRPKPERGIAIIDFAV